MPGQSGYLLEPDSSRLSHLVQHLLNPAKRSALLVFPDSAAPLDLKRKINTLLLDQTGTFELHPRTPIECYSDSMEANGHGSSPRNVVYRTIYITCPPVAT